MVTMAVLSREALRESIDGIFDTKLPIGEKRRLAGRAVCSWLAMSGGRTPDPQEIKGQGCAAAAAILEDVRAVAGKDGSKATVQATKQMLREQGARGQRLAARVGKVSKARSAVVHELSLPGEVAKCLTAAEAAKDDKAGMTPGMSSSDVAAVGTVMTPYRHRGHLRK